MRRFGVLAASLLAALPATARADILWDLVHDAGSGGSYGATSKTITKVETVCGAGSILACGSVVASTQSTNFVFGNEYDQGGNNGGSGALGAYNMSSFNDKGLGICVPGSTTDRTGCNASGIDHREIDATGGTTPLYLDLTGVLNSGPVNHIWLSSAQSASSEGWEVWGSLVGTAPLTGTSYVELCFGVGQTLNTDIADCAIPTSGYRFLQIRSAGAGDISVQALRFGTPIAAFSVSPEPGTMALLATGLVALTGAGLVRRRKKS